MKKNMHDLLIILLKMYKEMRVDQNLKNEKENYACMIYLLYLTDDFTLMLYMSKKKKKRGGGSCTFSEIRGVNSTYQVYGALLIYGPEVVWGCSSVCHGYE